MWERVSDVEVFYNSASRGTTEKFIRQYGVEYIVVGQLERATYTAAGLSKFEAWEGDLWEAAYRDGETVVYHVLDED